MVKKYSLNKWIIKDEDTAKCAVIINHIFDLLETKNFFKEVNNHQSETGGI